MHNVEPTTADQAAAVAEQGAHVAPQKAAAKTANGGKTGKGKAATAKKSVKAGGKATKVERTATAAKKASTPRADSKGAKILALIQRPKGATLAEIMKATGWQAHSVRGLISTAGKKHAITVESSKNDAGDRVYKAAK